MRIKSEGSGESTRFRPHPVASVIHVKPITPEKCYFDKGNKLVESIIAIFQFMLLEHVAHGVEDWERSKTPSMKNCCRLKSRRLCVSKTEEGEVYYIMPSAIFHWYSYVSGAANEACSATEKLLRLRHFLLS